jgi:glycosidase
MEFHISKAVRKQLGLSDQFFSYTGDVIFANVTASRELARRMDDQARAQGAINPSTNAGELFAMGLIDELSHAMIARYRREVYPNVLSETIRWFSSRVTPAEMERLLVVFSEEFPALAVYRGELTTLQWLNGSTDGVPHRESAFEEMLLLWLSNNNPAFTPFRSLFADTGLKQQTAYAQVTAALPNFFEKLPPVAPELGSLLDALRAPMLASPDSLTGQLDFIREHWTEHLGEEIRRVLLAIDVLREESVAIWMRFHPAGPDNHRHAAPGFGGEGFIGDEYVGLDSGADFVTGSDGVRRRRYAADYQAPLVEYEAFSADQAWMPTVVLIAKNTYVWLEQLSKKYQRHIHRLDQIPEEELWLMASRGITGLWLIGLWERSKASRTIKRLRGNPDAVASAYSLMDYLIAEDLGGEAAYAALRDRAAAAGLKLASDMVPNHMGIDSTWVVENPDWFLYRNESPFPVYSFNGPDLSTDSRVEIKIEDHYYEQTDAAVVFRLRHLRDNRTRFMYHGNDGTTFAWNDTAQLDYSKAAVREHVIQVILNVARRFPIIRFDAAMVLAKRHVQRLWFPLPGAGGSIPSRAEDAITEEQFDALMPHEFWREVVDRVAVEVPGTLLLAEAFWLLEGYFVRTLGMHRVYNSAFMNMLRDEENAKYRSYLKKTVEFDPDILKRYVNFMSNPDERTAVDQFGDGDKYFGVSVLLATLPGLPMFGHGQIEGYTERYGMDFKQARLDEVESSGLIARHNSLIAPLLKSRWLFAESTNFVLYDFWTVGGTVDENVFAYSNRAYGHRAVVFYNNRYGSTHGTIHISVGFLEKASGVLEQRSLAEGLALPAEPWMVIGYRDVVTGLEYLRRVEDLRRDGLTVGLQGYQHVVLLHWRELRPTTDEPWDRLSDMLNGAGVPNLDAQLAKLKLRPLIETLRPIFNPSVTAGFVEVARSFQQPKPAIPMAPELSEEELAAPRAATSPEVDASDEPAPIEEPEAPLDPRLEPFVAGAERFFAQAAEMSAGPARDLAVETAATRLTESLGAVLNLGDAVADLPKVLTAPARLALPLPDSATPEKLWPPVLAWLLAQMFPSAEALTLFDKLQLRSAYAEAFTWVGLEGEAAWWAAAQVRALLKVEAMPEPAILSAAFWDDPDILWLAGANTAFGVEYIDRDKLEQLLCWLQLPALLSGQVVPDAALTEVASAAKEAGYQLRPFLAALTAVPAEAGDAAETVSASLADEVAVEEL